jgi:hypothetical protein
MDGIKFEQGTIKTERRSRCPETSDCCGSMEMFLFERNEYVLAGLIFDHPVHLRLSGCAFELRFSVAAEIVVTIFICAFLGESDCKSKPPIWKNSVPIVPRQGRSARKHQNKAARRVVAALLWQRK